MNWRTDPPNLWTGIYRVVVLIFLAYLVTAHIVVGNIPSPEQIITNTVPTER